MKQTLIAPIAAALTLPLAMAAPAAAQKMLTGANPLAVVSAIRDEGYKATLAEDDAGKPVIESRMGRSNFSIYFLGCDDAQGCNSIQFSSGYGLDAPITLAALNDWNRSWRYGRAYSDEAGNAYLKYDINMDLGITRENFADSLDIWRLILIEFEDAIGW